MSALQAEVFRAGHDFYVSLSIAGEEVDVAGPFDDQADAEHAAIRNGHGMPSFDEGIRPVASWSGGRYLSARERRLQGVA